MPRAEARRNKDGGVKFWGDQRRGPARQRHDEGSSVPVAVVFRSANGGGIAEAVDTATLPSATSASSGSDRTVYGLAGVVSVLAAVAGAGALWRRRRVR